MSSSSASAAATSSAASSSGSGVPPQYRSVGIILAVSSGVLIGSSFVFKKKGLIRSQKGGPAGEGVAYLKSPLWWLGMTMMIIGELCNFGAYAFVEAIVVTPLGALSVVICAILSSIFLNEKLSFFGWIGCIQCIIGSIVIALNAPEEQSATTIVEFKHMFLAPGFLSFGSIVIVSALVIIFFVAPKYGKTSMLWYILVCSLIGGLSVSCTQGLGASIVTSIRGENQFKNWFIYFLLVFVVVTLITEIYYLNVALALFNTAMVTPTYYVIFTFCTLVTSIILYQGLHATVTQILTVVLGFLMICTGITILQMSKVDPRKLQNLDRRTTLLLAAARQEVDHGRSRSPRVSRARRRRHTEGEPQNGEYDVEKVDDDLDMCSIADTEEPGLDALRGGGFGAVGTLVRARRRSTIVHEGRARRGTVTSQGSARNSEDAGHAGIGTKRFRSIDGTPPLPPDSARKIEAARRHGASGSASGNGATAYGPSLQSASANVNGLGDLQDEPAVMKMLEMGDFVSSPGRTPDLHRGPSTGGVHFRDGEAGPSGANGPRTPEAHYSRGRMTPDSHRGRMTPDLHRGVTTPDPLRSGTPDPYNPGTYVLRVPAPAGSASAVPRRVVSPPLSRTPTPTRKDWKSSLGGRGMDTAIGASRVPAAESEREPAVEDGDASRVPRLSAESSAASVRVQPAQSEYFPAIPAPSDGESEYGDAPTTLAPPPLGGRSTSGFARSDRATVADSVWVPSPDEAVQAGEVRAGRGVLSGGVDEGTVSSEGVEQASAEGGEGSESVGSAHALLKRSR